MKWRSQVLLTTSLQAIKKKEIWIAQSKKCKQYDVVALRKVPEKDHAENPINSYSCHTYSIKR
jgi:hypothetical protein